MNDTQQLILNTFKQFHVSYNEYLPYSSMNSKKINWTDEHQENFESSLQELVNQDYIQLINRGYILTEKGYNFIFMDYSIEDTKSLIMNEFKKREIQEGQGLQVQVFNEFTEYEQFHADNFINAMDQLINEEKLRNGNNFNYILTKTGHNTIYGN